MGEGFCEQLNNGTYKTHRLLECEIPVTSEKFLEEYKPNLLDCSSSWCDLLRKCLSFWCSRITTCFNQNAEWEAVLCRNLHTRFWLRSKLHMIAGKENVNVALYRNIRVKRCSRNSSRSSETTRFKYTINIKTVYRYLPNQGESKVEMESTF